MLRSFLTKVIILTTGLATIIFGVNYLIPFFKSFQLFTWVSLAFFFALTILTGYIGFRSLEKTAHGFVSSVNGMVMLKLFLSVIFIVVYIVLVKPHGASFITSFFVLYVVYTVFEIRELILAQKIQQKQDRNGKH